MDLETLKPRFEEKYVINETSGCWIWTGAKLPSGYGQIKIPGARKQVYAHRLAWMLHRGEVPQKMRVLHKCDNPTCVNPEHLFLGSSRDNMQDMKRKGRHLYGERNVEAKLKTEQVERIKTLLAGSEFTQLELAKMYSVSPMTISRIARGERWAHVSPELTTEGVKRHPNLTSKEEAAIRDAVGTQAEVAVRYGVSQPTVCRVKQRN